MSLNEGNNPQQITSYDFGLDLALALIQPHVQRRPSINLQFDVQRKMKLFLGEQQFRIGESSGITILPPEQYLAKFGIRKLCRICCKNKVNPGQKKEKRISTSQEISAKLVATYHACSTVFECVIYALNNSEIIFSSSNNNLFLLAKNDLFLLTNYLEENNSRK